MALTVIIGYFVALLLVMAWATSRSGAADVPASSQPQANAASRIGVTAPVHHCRSAHRAIAFYARRVAYWRDKMGAGRAQGPALRDPASCPRYFAHVLQRKAYGLRHAFERWHAYHFAWWKWLPYDWQARSRCELGYSLQPRSWRSNVFTSNGNFQGFVNFYDGTWDSYRHADYPTEAYRATPRQQYEVALDVAASAGLGAWQSCATP